MEDNQEKNQEEYETKVTIEEPLQEEILDTPQEHLDLPKEWRLRKDHPIQNVIGDISKGVTTQ